MSVQEMLEDAFHKLLRTEIALTGAGRTDAGVHAKQLYAHFDIDKEGRWSVDELEQLRFRLNRFIPPSIVVKSILPVKKNAHARFDALSRSYEYHLHTFKNPFKTGQSFYFEKSLDDVAMNEAASFLLGKQDFKCFSRSKTDVKTYICDVSEALWEAEGDDLVFRITADRFLRNMVRAVVGTLLEIGEGKQQPEHIKEVISVRDRSMAGPSAPAHGLYLTQVGYPEEIFI